MARRRLFPVGDCRQVARGERLARRGYRRRRERARHGGGRKRARSRSGRERRGGGRGRRRSRIRLRSFRRRPLGDALRRRTPYPPPGRRRHGGELSVDGIGIEVHDVGAAAGIHARIDDGLLHRLHGDRLRLESVQREGDGQRLGGNRNRARRPARGAGRGARFGACRHRFQLQGCLRRRRGEKAKPRHRGERRAARECDARKRDHDNVPHTPPAILCGVRPHASPLRP